MKTLTNKGQAVRKGMALTYSKLVDQHRQWGEPLVVYRDGKVVFQPVDESLQVAESRHEYKVDRTNDDRQGDQRYGKAE